MHTSLTRNLSYWLLLILSVASVGLGGWLVARQIGSMSATPLDGTATVIDIYVAQSLVVIGAVLLGAGVVGFLLALALGAAKSVLRPAAPVVVDPIDWSTESATEADSTEVSTPVTASEPAETPDSVVEELDHAPATNAADAPEEAAGSETLDTETTEKAAEEEPATTR